MKQKLIILFLLLSSILKAQIFPVQVTPIVVPPYSVVLSEYSNAFREQVIVNLLLGDISANRDVRLVFSLTSNTGINVQSAPVVVGATPYRLSGGIPLRLSNADLQPYFQLQNLIGINPQQYASPLPDGLYEFCFQVIDERSGQPISRNTCTQAFIRQNDPPFLNYPKKGQSIQETNPTNIVFNWTPRHLNATNVEYEFTLTELWDEGIDPQTAFFTSPPLYQTTTKATTLLYGPTEPALLPNKNYGWRVRAVVNDGISQTSTFKNNGYSEIWHFRHNGICRAPQFGLTVPKTATSQIIRWQFGEYTAYKVQYRKVGGSSNAWFEERATSFEEAVTIYNLEKNTTYEYRIGGQCRRGEDFVYGNPQQFKTVSNSEEAGGYQCGALPDITITNQEPLERLGVNETFFAGDFPVTAKFVEQVAVGRYTGVGYVTVPYLADTRILVKFENIAINTDKQLTNGIVETTFDPSFSGVDDISDELEALEEIGKAVADIVKMGIDESAEAISDFVEAVRDKLRKNKDEIPESVQEEIEEALEQVEESKEEYDNTETEEEKEQAIEQFEKAKQTVQEKVPEPKETPSDEDSNPKIWFAGDDKLYSDGETITVPYKPEIIDFAFRLKNYPKEAEIKWEVLFLGTDNTSKYAQNETTLDNLGINTGNTKKLTIVAYYNDEKISVEFIRENEEYQLKELWAIHRETRKAKSGEKLYVLKNTEDPVNLKLDINPELSNACLNNIMWYKDNTEVQNILDRDKISLTLPLSEKINTTYLVEAGNPLSLSKDIDVEWFERNFGKNTNAFDFGFDLMPYIEELAKKFDVPVRNDKSDWDQDRSFSILSDLSYLTQTENKEDPRSRLYFNETKKIIKVKLGVKGKFEKPIPSLAIPSIDDTYLGFEIKIKAGIYFFAEANAYGEIGHTKFIEDWIEEKDKRNKEYNEYGNPSQIVLNGSLGLDPKLTLKLSDKIDGSISGKSDVYGQILKYDIRKNEIEFPILQKGIELRCLPKAHFKIKINNVIKWSYTSQWNEYIYYLNWNDL